jgi:hypothetical protein
MSGAIALCATAAVIAMAGGVSLLPALGVACFIAARALPSILYVRTVLRSGNKSSVIAAHVAALIIVALYGSRFAIAAMAILLTRAIAGFILPVPPAKTIGWREIAFGVITVALGGA